MKSIKCKWDDGYERVFGPFDQKTIDQFSEEEILSGFGVVIGDQVVRPVSLEFLDA